MSINLLKPNKVIILNRGISLVEVLLYVSVLAIVLTAMSAYYGALVESQVKNTTVLEVEQQGVLVAQKVMQAVRNAEVVNSPSPGNKSSFLSLDTSANSADPTTLSLTDGSAQISEGGGGAVPLTNDRVMVEGLLFENLARDDTTDIIRLTLTITHVNPEGRYEYSYQKTFRGSAVVRQPD